MALEIMQLVKYDAKQLLQNIVKYIFNHPFLSQKQPDEALSRRSSRIIDGFPLFECNLVRKTEASSQEDCMSFPLDDDSSGRSSMKSTYGFSLDNKVDIRKQYLTLPTTWILLLNTEDASHKLEITALGLTILRLCFCIWTPMDVSSSSAIASKPSHSQCKSRSAPLTSVNMKTKSSAPMPILCLGTFGTSQGSMDIGDALEQPSTHRMTRIKSLRQCASSSPNWSSGFDGILAMAVQKWDRLGGQMMSQVLRIMKNYARQLNACLELKVCSMNRKAQHYGFDYVVRHISNAYQCSSPWKPWLHRGSSSILETLGVHSLKLGLDNLVLKCKWL
ncbi:hypothetical protein AAG906_012400 [Vitis piasezkii]